MVNHLPKVIEGQSWLAHCVSLSVVCLIDFWGSNFLKVLNFKQKLELFIAASRTGVECLVSSLSHVFHGFHLSMPVMWADQLHWLAF